MSLKILIDLECSFTLVDEIYSYQVFFMIIIIIHTVWIQEKACSYSCFLLKPPAVQNLVSASQWVILEATHIRSKYYSLFRKMSGSLGVHRLISLGCRCCVCRSCCLFSFFFCSGAKDTFWQAPMLTLWMKYLCKLFGKAMLLLKPGSLCLYPHVLWWKRVSAVWLMFLLPQQVLLGF